jgi:predicted transcriptional regulator
MKTSTINLSIPGDLLTRADAVAKRESRSRSEVMRTALQAYLERRAGWDLLFAMMDQHVAGKGLQPGDVQAAIREIRGRA